MVDRVEDVRPGPGPLPPDIIVAAVQDARPGFRARHPNARATAVLVFAIAAALVIPGLLLVRGWSEAQQIRGVGAGRGVLTVAACGDRKVTVSTDSDGNQSTSVTYTCTGTFHGSSASLDNVAVESDVDYHAGVRTAAYVNSADHVYLADNPEAAAHMALWFTSACVVAGVEAAAIRLLHRRVRGRKRTVPGREVFDAVTTGVIGLFVVIPALILFWLASVLAFWGIYAS